jgi:hypothetical protein
MVGAQRPFWCRLGLLARPLFHRRRADVIADTFVFPLGGPIDGYQIGAANTIGSTTIVVYSVTHVVVRRVQFCHPDNCPFRFKA